MDRVYLVEAHGFLSTWGDDPHRKFMPVREVISIESSPLRLPASLANKLYLAGESGMGYVIFTAVLRDGSQLQFAMGNAVDFPDWPPGVNPQEVVDVLPHEGRDAFREYAHTAIEKRAKYFWCLYSI